jgi:hypothetical protein
LGEVKPVFDHSLSRNKQPVTGIKTVLSGLLRENKKKGSQRGDEDGNSAGSDLRLFASTRRVDFDPLALGHEDWLRFLKPVANLAWQAPAGCRP